jgi:hypothetical protein
MKRLASLLAVALVASALPALAQAPAGGPPPTRIRGTITAVNGDTLTINTMNGPAKVTLAPNATVRVVTKLGLADIKEGSFVGVTSVTNPDGTTVAKEVHVFPPALAAQKPGEGTRPWDLFPQSTMTNATVTAATPGKVANIENRTITLTYPSGTKTILVPATTPIVTYASADPTALTVGTKVVIIAATPTADGFTTSSVTAGHNGVDPPM